MTKVVNLRIHPYEIYIGRSGKGESGDFGNPHVVGFCKICNKIHKKGDAVIEFKEYFYDRLETDPIFKRKVLALKDKTLGCFCLDKNGNGDCHGLVIAEYLNNLN